VNRFGNVFHLEISSCHNVTEVRNLIGKIQFLTLYFCSGLTVVELSKEHYIHVQIIHCGHLTDFSILGTIYSLTIQLSEGWTKDTIPRKYQYLNGEEKEEYLLTE
jgi:hypothetical protein